MLRLFFLPEEQGNILFCVFQFEQLGLGFLVLLIKLGLFGGKRAVFRFQLVRAGQAGDVVCLEIGCCRPVCCQFCTVLIFKAGDLTAFRFCVSGRYCL